MNSRQTLYYTELQPGRTEIDQLEGSVVLEFGAHW